MLNSEITLFYQALADYIVGKRRLHRPLIIGINGVDGSGKTVLSISLGQLLKVRGYDVCRISVDDFHHPKARRYLRGELSPEGYYHDSINYDAVVNNALRPALKAKNHPVQCQTKYFNLELDKEEDRFQSVGKDTIVLIEGVFLFRAEMLPFLHIKIFLDAHFETILKRVLIRDANKLGSEAKIRERYEKKYIPGQILYFEDVQPQSTADIVIDNNNPETPTIVTPPGGLPKCLHASKIASRRNQ